MAEEFTHGAQPGPLQRLTALLLKVTSLPKVASAPPGPSRIDERAPDTVLIAPRTALVYTDKTRKAYCNVQAVYDT